MFLTRSLWRKMGFGLGLVLGMLFILSLGGIFGLTSYRDVVTDPVFDVNHSPRQADLLAALATLQASLQPPSNPDLARSDSPSFPEQLEKTRGLIRRYQTRLSELPPTSRVTVMQPMLSSMTEGLDLLENKYNALGVNPTSHHTLALQRELIPLIRTASFLPDSQDGLAGKLREARQTYQVSFVLICVSSTVVLLLFLGLVVSGYRWIFAPLRQLHQGARRVAQGDFDYRVQLNTNDEMAELAEAFNQMTARFQEIASDLDRQVQERSRELIRSARLASVGFLAAGVAHEINNPLTAVKWTAESLTSRLEPLLAEANGAEISVVRRYLEMIQKESTRCQQITARLLDFARGQQAARSNVDLTALVGEVIELVSHIGHFRNRDVRFSRTVPCCVEANASEIKQVVLNLISNALESMETTDHLEIDLLDQTDQAVITFHDNGCGMTTETLENLFEPFFTQKRSGKGTGLGLSISHRIVRDHGGRIEATSDGLGRGSTFRVFLPRKAPQDIAA